MKILIISPFFAPYSGVGSSRMISLVNYLETLPDYDLEIVRNDPITYPIEYVKTTVTTKIKIHDVAVTGNFFSDSQLYAQVIDELYSLNKYDLILISVGPYYTLNGLCLLLKKIKNHIPYIIDYRDLWTFETFRNDNFILDIKRKISKYRYRITERYILEKSLGVIAVTKADQNQLLKKTSLPVSKVFLIKNGYEFPGFDIESNKSLRNLNEPTFGIFGKFGYYNKHFALKFLRAVKKLQVMGINVKIKHVGIRESYIEQAIEKLNFSSSIYFNTGAKSYIEGIKELLETDINLIIYSSKTGLGTKVYDYIMLNKPILAIVSKKSDLAKLVSTFDNGYITSTANGVVEFTNKIIQNKIHVLDKVKTHDYSRFEQNKKFVEIFNLFLKENENE